MDWHPPLHLPIFPLEGQAHPLWLLVAWFWQMLHLPLPTTTLSQHDSQSTKSLPLIQDPSVLSQPFSPFHTQGNRTLVLEIPTEPAHQGLAFSPENPQPRTKSGGKTLNGDWKHLRCKNLARDMATGDPRMDHSWHTHLWFFCWFFWPAVYGLQDPSPPTRDRTSDHAIESAES